MIVSYEQHYNLQYRTMKNINIGQLFTKTDVFPHRLYKWNDKKWIEVDKTGTNSYLTEDYIRDLVEKVAQGEIELEDLSDAEKSEMTDFLSNGRE